MLIKCSNHNFSSSQLKSCGQQSSQSVANVRWSFLFPSVSNLGPTAIWSKWFFRFWRFAVENCCWYKTIQTIFDKIVNFLSKLGRRRHHYLDLGKRTSVRCTANIWFLFWDDWNKHSNFVSLALPLRRKFKWFSLLGRQLWLGSGLRSPFFVIEKNSSHLLQISSPVQPWDNFAC